MLYVFLVETEIKNYNTLRSGGVAGNRTRVQSRHTLFCHCGLLSRWEFHPVLAVDTYQPHVYRLWFISSPSIGPWARECDSKSPCLHRFRYLCSSRPYGSTMARRVSPGIHYSPRWSYRHLVWTRGVYPTLPSLVASFCSLLANLCVPTRERVPNFRTVHRFLPIERSRLLPNSPNRRCTE